MNKFWNERTTTIAGLTVGILGLVLTMAFWWADRESHDISITVVSKAALHTELPDKIPNTIEITLNGNKIDHPYLSVITMKNAGTKPIIAKDFETNITIQAGQARILQALVTESAPGDLKPVISVRDNKIEISPLLLNSDDSLTFSVITDSVTPFFSANARIAGIQRIKVTDTSGARESRRVVMSIISGICLACLYAALSLCAFPSAERQLNLWATLLGALACAMGAVILLSIPAVDALGEKWGRIALFICLAPMMLMGFLMTNRRSRS
ncbi:hypothetical protein [Lysobacter sp. ESA13C]|uniref:hypothetical protein n=1 Tax=Lysobacter sp. ESA13C TaxID=2862676 RepID=UPI001CBDA026|nr:hypothetical protein [Lysobacter sp. ESA13C]